MVLCERSAASRPPSVASDAPSMSGLDADVDADVDVDVDVDVDFDADTDPPLSQTARRLLDALASNSGSTSEGELDADASPGLCARERAAADTSGSDTDADVVADPNGAADSDANADVNANADADAGSMSSPASAPATPRQRKRKRGHARPAPARRAPPPRKGRVVSCGSTPPPSAEPGTTSGAASPVRRPAQLKLARQYAFDDARVEEVMSGFGGVAGLLEMARQSQAERRTLVYVPPACPPCPSPG